MRTNGIGTALAAVAFVVAVGQAQATPSESFIPQIPDWMGLPSYPGAPVVQPEGALARAAARPVPSPIRCTQGNETSSMCYTATQQPRERFIAPVISR